MYNIEAKFETTFWLPLNKDFYDLFKDMGPVPGTEQVSVHTMSIENASEIPDEEFINFTCKKLSEAVRETIAKHGGKVRNTVFCGFTKVTKI